MSTFLVFVGIALLIFANGAFVALEFAAVGARRSNVDGDAATGRRSARAAQRIQGDLLVALTGAQLGITVCSLALGRVGEPAVAHLVEDALGGVELSEAARHAIGFAVGLGIIVVIHMVVGEMVPKNVTLADPERVLYWLARPMVLYGTLTRPVTRALTAAANVLLRLIGVKPQSTLEDVATRRELVLMVDASAREGLIDAEESALLGGVLQFGESTAADAMTPMADVDAVPTTATVTDVERALVETDHSRLIVYGDDLDDVRGFVHGKDLLSVTGPARHRRLPISRIRPMIRVNHDASLPEVLQLMRRGRSHLALVVRGGRPDGVLTLDDVFAGVLSGLTSPEQ